MNLQGKRVLLVEDEAIIAMTAEDMLDQLGCVTVASPSTLAGALAAAARGGFDVALLDINLNGLDSIPVATLLEEDNIPFVFTTGYGATGRDARFDDVPLVTKPYQVSDLADAIGRALAR
jgi:CheY-like chemotaxis protein